MPDPIIIIEASFIAGIGAGILFDQVPYFNTHFLSYGPRSKHSPKSTSSLPSLTTTSLTTLFAYPVPHSWFTHYYILSITLSIFWGVSLLTHNSLIQYLTSLSTQSPSESLPWQKIWLLWFLLLAQGCRRLYESLTLIKPSSSTMPLSIYMVGILYYLLDSIGIWIQGSATILRTPHPTLAETWAARYTLLSSPTTVIGLGIFVVASGVQNDCHRYLASLRKYTLPKHPVFNSVVCPHYLMECLIYMSLAIVGAPPGKWVNRTVLCTAAFTTVNLGIVAKSAKHWTVEKFGRDYPEVGDRWRMVPGVW